MGRKKHGPVRINNGLTWYVRLHIPAKLRDRAGKTRLIRSLETTDHTTALRSYGMVLSSLEKELEHLLRGDSIRDRVELWKSADLEHVEKAEALLGVWQLDTENKSHLEVFEAIANDKELPINWDELLELWIDSRNKRKSRGLSPESIASAKTAIDQIKPYGQPTTLTKKDVQRFVDEQKVKPTSVQTRCRMLSALIEAGIKKERIETNVFTKIDFTAETKIEDERLPFTDSMLCELYNDKSPLLWLCLTGMRPGEYASRRTKNLTDNIISITNEPDLNWRTKNQASVRRTPKPEGFSLMKDGLKPSTLMDYMQREAKDRFNNPRITPHSGRHTFYELSRRAGCDSLVIEAVTGHAKKRQSSQYGSFPDEVLIRECQKIWNYAQNIYGPTKHTD